MEKDFDYNSIPKTYLYCLNAKCTRFAKCLRYQAAIHANPKLASISVVNPSYIAGQEKDCPHFQPDRLSRFALGITNLLDKIPHAQAVRLRDSLYSHLGRSMYYRIRNRERLIHPEEQEFIRQLFLRYGIKEKPVFDEYVELYDWKE
ncbi:MAG: DUF6078 family protein [Bacteroides sp.]|nr:DUF6078 family protein [Bacteroides sp.]